jgi:hypothetical protein
VRKKKICEFSPLISLARRREQGPAGSVNFHSIVPLFESAKVLMAIGRGKRIVRNAVLYSCSSMVVDEADAAQNWANNYRHRCEVIDAERCEVIDAERCEVRNAEQCRREWIIVQGV